LLRQRRERGDPEQRGRGKPDDKHCENTAARLRTNYR
jgi:hypothetical protein